jgi:hypothetical protein
LLKTQDRPEQSQASPIRAEAGSSSIGNMPSDQSGPISEDPAISMTIPLPPRQQTYSWEMIGLGLEEPLPTQDAINELYDKCISNMLYSATNSIIDIESFLKRFICHVQ